MASERILSKKKDVVSEISNKIKASNAVILVDYKGLDVTNATILRRSLKEKGAEVKIYKNTLANLALKENGYDLESNLNGSNALVFSEDTLSAVKVVAEFIKDKKVLEMRVGLIDGEITDVDTLNKLAATPDKQTLLTMLATGMMGTVKQLAIGLDLYAKQKEQN